MSLRNELENVLARYALAYDDGDLDGVEQVFAEDAVLTLQIKGNDLVGPMNGRPEIMKLFRDSHATQTDQRRHVTSNILVEPTGDSTARTVSYLTITSAENGRLTVLTTGKYEDEWARVGDGWQLAKRHIALDLPY